MSAIAVLTQGPRNGSFTTASVMAPSNSNQIHIVCPMSDVDAQNPDLSCRIVTEYSIDGGKTWLPFGNPYNWHGGLSPRDGSFTKPDELLAPPSTDVYELRAVLDTLGNTLDTGVTLEVT